MNNSALTQQLTTTPGDNTVNSAKIVDGSILGTDIGSNTIANSNFLDSSVSGNKIQANAILQGHVANGYDDLVSNQTLSGIKIFNQVQMPGYPTQPQDLCNKSFVDNYPVENKLINGDFRIWQRGLKRARPADNKFTADRFQLLNNSANFYDIYAGSGTPLNDNAYNYQISTTSGSRNIFSSGTSFRIRQTIEGYNTSDLINKINTLGFYINSTVSGTFAVSLHNSSESHSYVVPFDVITPNTWEYKSFQIPHNINSGTWDLASGRGFVIDWCFGAANNLCVDGTNKWVNAKLYSTASGTPLFNGNPTNIIGTNFIKLSKVKLTPGQIDGFVETKPVSEELRKCQRYYCNSFVLNDTPQGGVGYWGIGGYFYTTGAGSSTHNGASWYFPVQMHHTPVITTWNPFTVAASSLTIAGGTAYAVFQYGINPQVFHFRTSADLTGGGDGPVNLNAEAEAEIL